ncbi:MAG: MmgE/PrpD family protein [Hyphomicrobiaceae bacterium]|nr:MAG: MmgE/PrpD family protein [Hyphomicrobiaceae bacterium]
MRTAQGVTKTLVDFAVGTRFEDIPGEVVHETKRLILDTIGCAIGSKETDLGRIAVEAAGAFGGNGGEATIWGAKARSSCVAAAFANAELANAMDADETLINFTHVAGSVLPPAMAAGERVGGSGKTLIAALARVDDIAARVGVAMPRAEFIAGDPPNFSLASMRNTDFAWHVFGSATATGKSLGFDAVKMANAFGIACVNAPINATAAIKGYTEFFPMTKYTVMGQNALVGMMGALLADKGFTGGHHMLDGDFGFFRLTGIEPTFPDELTKDLGRHWWVMEASYKPYPINRIPQPGLDIFYGMLAEKKFTADDVKEVVYKVHPRSIGHFDHWPIDDIHTSMQFSFCFPMGFAMAAHGIEPGPDWHRPQNIDDPRIKSFAKKVRMVGDPKVFQSVYDEVGNRPYPVKKIVTTIEVVTTSGRTFSGHKEYAKGDPWFADTRMSDDDIVEKFTRFTRQYLSKQQAKQLINAVFNLEDIEDVRELARLTEC